MSLLRRLIRICKFKNWELYLLHEKCPPSQHRIMYEGDLVIRDKTTGEILLKAHDVIASKSQLMRSCSEKLLCRLEVRQAEKELQEYEAMRNHVRKQQALAYLNEAYESNRKHEYSSKKILTSPPAEVTEEARRRKIMGLPVTSKDAASGPLTTSGIGNDTVSLDIQCHSPCSTDVATDSSMSSVIEGNSDESQCIAPVKALHDHDAVRVAFEQLSTDAKRRIETLFTSLQNVQTV